ncbi:MAG TPA: RNA polymerase subunit sigma-70 [Acidimicrobiia bacterium]|nr:RNA polymerase subunit sigma-70 [Acidimicrobiia bacterium]
MTEAAPVDLEAAFHRYRRRLHVHCYRMLGSFHEADDAVQETWLRAWRGRGRFDGRNLSAWLYRIATNVCLDQIRAHRRRSPALGGMDEVPWLQPYPDHLLDEVAADPEGEVVERETIELLFVAALQALPARQRAVLIARDVLDWSAAETAGLLGTTVTAINSALQRARAGIREILPGRRSEWAREASPEEEELLERFIRAHEELDHVAALAIASEDIRVTMPPDLARFDGIQRLRPLLDRAFGEGRDGDWRLVATRANRMPAAASYLRRPGDTRFRPFKLDVLRVDQGKVVEITTFGAALFPMFGLESRLG